MLRLPMGHFLSTTTGLLEATGTIPSSWSPQTADRTFLRHAQLHPDQAGFRGAWRSSRVNRLPELRGAFVILTSGDVILADDLDHALESCEKAVIAARSGEGGSGRGLREWFTQALGNADYAQQLAELCERLEFHQGDIVASQGDPADCMHFVLEGRVGVIVKFDDGRSIRVRSLGPHTTIGEMGLITIQARSATIQAEGESVLYALSIDAFERIGRLPSWRNGSASPARRSAFCGAGGMANRPAATPVTQREKTNGARRLSFASDRRRGAPAVCAEPSNFLRSCRCLGRSLALE